MNHEMGMDLKIFFSGIFLNIVLNSCSANEDAKLEKSKTSFSPVENQISFAKSAEFDWKNKKVSVSFEDALEKFSTIEKNSKSKKYLGFSLTKNNLKQGVTIQLKINDLATNKEKITEIMIENYDLKLGFNQFKIGHQNNKPYIIY